MARKRIRLNNTVEILDPVVDDMNRFSRVGYVSPRDHYVYSPEKITIREIAVIWKGVKFCKHDTLVNRAVREKWVQKRKEFWERAAKKAEEKLATKASRQIVKANERHIGIGKALQGTAAKVLKVSVGELDKRPDDLKPGEGLRVSASMAKAGVDIERRGLGLADSVVHVQNVREIVMKVLSVVSRHVQEPDILQNIVHDLRAMESAEEESMRENVLQLTEPDEEIEF